jgi:hypothetical protein
MKKALILIIAGLCLFQINGLSQKTQVGLTGGITFSNIYGEINGSDTRGDVRAGFTVGMILDAPIWKTGFTFQPGVHYVQKGMFTKKTDNLKEAVALRYCEFQLNVVKYTGSQRLFFGLGPAIALNLPSKEVVINEDADTKIETSILFGKDPTDKYRGLDIGINGLLGMRFKCGMLISASYTFGLSNMLPAPENDDELRNGCLSFRIGYLFKNSPSK